MENIETFGSPLLQDVAFNDDGSLKQTGKQNIKFYNKKRLSFKAKKDEDGNLIMDKKTGLPFKEAFEEVIEMVRVETKGDTTIKDDVADDFSKRQFYRQYKYFREGRVPDGNPIEDFEFLQPSTVMELHMLGIHVLQQIPGMSDLECDQLRDQSGYEVRDIATQWVQINTPHGQTLKANKLEMEVAQLKRQLQDLQLSKNKRPLEESFSSEVKEEPISIGEITPEQFAERRGPGRPKKLEDAKV